MSELNPHIVKETEGEAYTIQRFVTGKPLAADGMLPDEHGVYPVSPLGFLMSNDGTPLTSAPPTEIMVSYPIYDESGNPITPESKGNEWPAVRDALIEQAYATRGKYNIFYGDSARYHVISLRRESDTLVVVVDGEIIVSPDTVKFFFENATEDDYAPTGILSSVIRKVFEPVAGGIHVDGDRTTVILDIGLDDIAFSGIAGEGKLVIGAIAYNAVSHEPMRYIVVDPSNGAAISGFYMFGESSTAPFRRVFTYETMYPPVEPSNAPICNSRNGYSNGEVTKWVERHVSPLIRNGLHPYSSPGELGDAGAFVRWFASCGEVDIAGGGGTNPVIVSGFGLGTGYVGGCYGGTKMPSEGSTDAGTVHKQLVFGYGTKHDAMQLDVGKAALPCDWPFTDFSAYAGVDRENNITLVRHGFAFNGETYGALERDIAECSTCHGTGLVAGTVCPTCGGTGESPVCDACNGTGEIDGQQCMHCGGIGRIGTTHVVMDRIHVCLFNDFRPSDSTNGHVDGTTVLKKTFINLATPINTKDGEELQVTVSMPNEYVESAFSGSDTLKNLNGYYAFISQPRVYVVSGTWLFSNTKVNFTIDDGMQVLTLNKELLNSEGYVLAAGTAVRMKLSFGCYTQKKFSVTGTVDGTTVTLDEPIKDDGLKGALRREALRLSRRENTSCGAAYVEPNNATLPPGIQNLGLNAVRNENGALGFDNTGNDGSYNKVYNSRGEYGRPGILYEYGNKARKDQRQVIATVYPTVTNTFEWNITHRKKIGVLDRLMTMDAEAGNRSIYSRIFEMNQKIIDCIHPGVTFAPAEYPLDILAAVGDIATAMPDDADLCSFIGAVLNVGEGGEQPVNQARRAAAMLADDYRNARVKRDSVGSLGSLNILADDGMLADEWNFGAMYAADTGTTNDYEHIARSIRLRNMPPVLATAGTSPSGLPDSEVLQCFPFKSPEFEFYAGNPYEFGLYESDAMTEEVPCEIADKHSSRAYSMNSVVEACLKSGFNWLASTDTVDDLIRSAELAAVDMQNEPDLLKPHGKRSSSCGWMEAIDAFAKLVSPDNIPVPRLADAYDYSDIAGKPYLTAGDAYGRYRFEHADEVTGARFIPTDLPSSDALAMFLKDYVPSYSASLPKRNWDSWRVVLPNDVGTGSYDDEPVFQSRVKWNPLVCNAESRGRYAADGIFVGTGFNDPNMNRLELDDSVSVDASIPPYTCQSGYSENEPFSTESDKYAVGYIRVYMKFTFSADAGRWYCTDYRQAPISYLTPLYGAKAIEETLPGSNIRIWNRSACGSFSWREATRHLYSELMPLEINANAIGDVMGDELRHRRLATPYNPVSTPETGKNGIGLSAPLDKNGNRGGADVQMEMPHANFWSVYEHVRPAVSAMPKSDIPRYYMDTAAVKHYLPRGGIMSDAVLWGQYEYPEKRRVEYHLPDAKLPDLDTTMHHIVYAVRNNATGSIDTGDIAVGGQDNAVLAFSKGESTVQQ